MNKKKEKVEGLKWILEKLRWKGLNILGYFYFLIRVFVDLQSWRHEA